MGRRPEANRFHGRRRALALGGGAALSQETIVLRAWTIGPEDASITRSTNLEAAAERLNAALEEENEPYRVRVEAAFESDSWVAHRRRIPPLSSRPG